MGANLVVVHGGGPSAVINASLYGVIQEARASRSIGKVYAAIGGTGGLIKERLRDLSNISDTVMDALLRSPASAIGTSRDGLDAHDYEAMIRVLRAYNIEYVLLNGGNGTMDTCGKLHALCRQEGIKVIGIPKTMDNDLAVTDHSPGFGSAARYIAGSVAELCADVASLPIHIVVLEVMGRNAGWLAASSALARDSYGDGPDLIYVPERVFSVDEFLEDVQAIIHAKGFGVVVVSEGLHGEDGKPIVDPIFSVGRDTYFGDVSAYLSQLIIKKLAYKSRNEKPGLLGRASVAWQSSVDREEAILAGRVACQAVLAGESGKMVAFRRLSSEPYRAETFLVDVREVMMHEKKLPAEFINGRGDGVTEDFLSWCRPLVGTPLPRIIDLRSNWVQI